MRSQKLRRRPDSCHAFHPEVGLEGVERWGFDFIPKFSALWLCLRTEDMSASGHRMQLHVETFRRMQQILSQPGSEGPSTNRATQLPGFGPSVNQIQHPHIDLIAAALSCKWSKQTGNNYMQNTNGDRHVLSTRPVAGPELGAYTRYCLCWKWLPQITPIKVAPRGNGFPEVTLRG